MSIKFLVSLALMFHPALHHETRSCERTYTVAMAVRAIDATYHSGLPVTRPQKARLRIYIRCQRNRAAEPYVTRVWRVRASPVPLNGPAIASWYYDAGATGCGFHAHLGVATLVAPCGARFRICNGSRCIVATRDDSGPYVGGRTFDLDPISRTALACSALCTVKWRRVQ